MKLAVIGLGRMGMNMAKRLLKGGHRVVAYNRTKQKTREIARYGAIPAFTLKDAVKKAGKPGIIWLMLPAGKITDEYIDQLVYLLSKGDIIIDGSNGNYKDDIIRAEALKKDGIYYIDAGVSGGIWGLRNGYCIMIGGEKKIFNYIEQIIKTLAPENGYMYCGNTGAGHYVKMIHNAIEYAMMEAYAEGFHILKSSKYGKDIKLEKIAKLWQHGSVIRSWLLELLIDVFRKDDLLKDIDGYVEDSGEARWALNEAIELGVAADVIAISLFKRFNSRQQAVFANKILASLRNRFGGHMLTKVENGKSGRKIPVGKKRNAVNRGDNFAGNTKNFG